MTKNEFDAVVNADIKALLEREENFSDVFLENLLEDAAMLYGRAVSDYESACLHRLHESIYIQLRENIADAAENLKDAAMQHFDDRFDGGAE